MQQARTIHRLALFQNCGVCGGGKSTTQPQHVTSRRRSQVGRRPSRKGCRVRASGLPRGESGALGPGPRGPLPWGSGGEEPRPGHFRVPEGGGVGARQRAGSQPPGPSPPTPPPGFLRRPRPPCCCGAEAAPRSPSGRDRLRNRFVGGSLTTKRPRRRRRLLGRVSRRPPAPAPLVPRGAGPRCDVREARWRARWVKLLPGLPQGAGQVRTPPRPPRGGSRAGLGAPHDADGPSGARAAPELGPWRAWRRRAETSGAGFLPPRRSQGGRRGAGAGLPLLHGRAPAPGRGLFWQVRTPRRAEGGVAPSLSGCAQKRDSPEGHPHASSEPHFIFTELVFLPGKGWCGMSGEPHPGASK